MEEKEKNSRTSSSRTGSAGREGIRLRRAAKRNAAAGTKDPDGRRTDRLKGEGPRGEGLKIEEPKPGDR